MNSEVGARELICEIGRRIHERGYSSGIDGNISIKISKTTILVTPSGVNKGWLKPDDLLTVSVSEGKKIKGHGNPTSELQMHLAAYRLRSDISAVVHAHPKTAVALSILDIPISLKLIAEDILQCGFIPTVQYARPGSKLLADTLGKTIANHDAVILARHGCLTVGNDLEQAYNRLECLEHCGSN